MVFESEILPFLEWLFRNPKNMLGLGALPLFLLAVAVLTIFGSFFAYLTAMFRHGPFEAFYVVAKVIATAIPDLVRMSPRRVGAMSWLAIKEALRNRVLVAFAVFAVILLIGSWYLDSKSDDPAKVYLSVVLTSTNFLTVLLGLFLSGMSLPTDIKNRTIYTIVTKPVRAGEIVLGRIIGFSAIGTAILVIMYVVSFIFVFFGLRHTHEIDARDLTEVSVASSAKAGDKQPGEGQAKRGESSQNRHHRHLVTIYPDGAATTDSRMNHNHPVRKVGEGDDAKYVLDPPTNNLRARIPHMGELEFVDRSGGNRAKKGGISVGEEWAYRSYIEGGSLARAIWTFKNVTPDEFPDGLPVELTIRVFRTYKANIERRVTGSIVLKNPNPRKSLQSTPIIFESAEYSVQEIKIPRKQPIVRDGKLITRIKDGDQERDVELFDLVENGQVELWLECVDPSQYFGMAQPDVYLKRADGSFALNLLKGYYSIWLRMVLVICLGVTFSTFLSGAVAMMATVSTLLIGYFSQFIVELFASLFDITGDNSMGGGPIESLLRILMQKNLSVDLDIHWLAVEIIRKLDFALFSLMWLGAQVLPNFRQFDTSEMVATGYDVFGGLLAQHTVAAMGYVLVLAVLGYFFLRTREIAA